LDTDGYQAGPAITGLADGAYLIAWTSGSEVYAQRFGASGQRLGSEFRVNTYTNNDQGGADVAKLEDGGFVITWASVGQDGSGAGVYAQRYNAAGMAVGDEVQVNTTTGSDQSGAAVTALADGGYAITWSYDDQWTNGGIYAQVFDASGARVAGEQRISTTSDRGHNDATIAALANGSFVVAWGYIGDQTGVFARQFNPVASSVGDGGNNSLTGTTARDFIDGGAGNDQIAGLSGDDTLSGDAGTDRLFGGTGHDYLSADQAVSFDNGATVDELYGGAGNDFLFSGFGDIVDGGDGYDTVGLSYVGASAGITGDTAILHKGQPLVAGGGTFVSIERFSDIAMTQFDDKMVIGDQHDPATVRGWNGNDHLIGQEVSITMYGGNGDDLLVGGRGDDELIGENGDDLLIGFHGIDLLFGGEGFDRFIFVNLDFKDRIVDFQRSADKIDLSDLDANTLVSGDQAFTFIGGAAFSGIAGELRFFTGDKDGLFTGYFIGGDVNGDQAADFTVEVGITLSGNQLSSSDFIL
jgi:Ca2+-binding RTX toxin-like protein